MATLGVVAVSIFAADQPVHQVSVSALDKVIPQFVFGGGWNTSVTLVNLGLDFLTMRGDFYTSEGQPMIVPIAGRGRVQAMELRIPVGGTLTFETEEGDLTTQQGWMLLDIPAGARLTGLAVFRRRVPGRPESEAVVPLCKAMNMRTVVAYDNLQGFNTGVAVVNPSRTTTANIAVIVRDQEGNRLFVGRFTLPPLNHTAFVAAEEFTQSKERRGILEFIADTGEVAALGLRFNPSGTFTSFHAFDP